MINTLLAHQWLLDWAYLYERPNGLGPQKDNFFWVYNILTGEMKRTTSCGRCLAQMRLRLQQYKKQLDNMNSHHVYRTQKGTLTLVQQATDPIFLIKASTPQKAKEMLQVLKDFEKQEAKKIDQIKL